MLALVSAVGRQSLSFAETTGESCLMLFRTLWGAPHPKLFSLFVRQVFQLGILSLPIILLVDCIMSSFSCNDRELSSSKILMLLPIPLRSFL